MNSQVVGLRVSGVIFLLMCVAQLARLLMGVEVLIAGYACRCGRAELPPRYWAG